MYLKKTTYAGDYLRIEKYFAGRYGCHKPRAEHHNKTPPVVRDINQRRAEQKLLDLIRANFKRGEDAHVVLTYAGIPPDKDTAKKQVAQFIRRLRADYRKQGEELKYIQVTEYEGKRIHHHFVVNCVKFAELIIKNWEQNGAAHIIALYTNDFDALADYLVKETSVRENPETGYRRRWSCSQNLVKPKVRVEQIHSKKWRSKLPDTIKDYRLVHESAINAINIDGRPWQSVTYRRE